MASLQVLEFDHEGRPVQFDTWLDDLQLYPLSDSKDTQALYDAVVARYSSPATAALGRLLLPYLFPELYAFPTIADLVSHLRASDTGYRAAAPAEFLDRNPPPMFITLYFIVTRLPDSLRSVRDHFLSLDPNSLTVDLLEQHLLAAETSAVAVGAARGTPRPPFFKGCSPSPLAPSYASAASADVSVPEDVGAASTSAKRRSSKGKGGWVGGSGSGGGGGGSGRGGGGSSGGGGSDGTVGGSGGSGGGGGGSGGSGGSEGSGTGGGGTGARRVGSGGGQRQQQQCRSETLSPQQLREWFLRGASGGSCPYVIRTGDRAGQTCRRLHTQHCCFSRLDDACRAEFGDDVELPRWADLLVVEGDRYRCVPPDPGSSLYTLSTEPSQVAASAQVSASGQVAASCSCRLLSHQTLLWHHRLGHPSLPRLRGMHSRLLVSGLPRSLPPLPPSPTPPSLPCVEGRQRAAPHSSSFPPTSVPLRTLHMDVWGPARDLPVLRLHSDRGGEFSSTLLRDFCRGEGILQSFTLPDSLQQNGIAERRIGLVMEVACTSMIHAAAPHFLWPFAVRYTAHQLNLWPRVSLPETSPTVRWTGEVGDASVFRVWGSRAFVRDPSADKLSPCAIPCVFLGFVPDAPCWQFYHPTSRRVFPSQDVTFDESVPFYRLFPYRSAPPPPPPLFLAPGPPPVDPLPPQGPAPSGMSQVDPLPGPARVQVAVGSGAARGAASGGAESGGAEPGGAEPGGVESEGAETGGAEPGGVGTGGAEPEGVEPGGAASEGAESGGAEPQGAASSGGSAGASPRLSPQQLFVARAGGTGGAAATGPGGAHTRDTGAAGTGGVEGAGAGDLTESGATDTGGAEARGARVGGTGAGGAGAAGAGVGGTGVAACVLPVSPVRTARRAPHSRPPPVPGTHAMTLRPSSVPLRVPLPAPLASSLPEVSNPVSDRARAAIPTVSCLLASAVTDPLFESAAASALVAELLDFAAACRLDYATPVVAESASASPPSIGGECALGTDVLEDRQEDFECLAAAVPRFSSMLLAPMGDPDAPDIPTPRSYAEAVTGPYSSQWQAAMDAEMASWKSTGTYVDEVPLPGANIVDGMWIFRGVDYFETFSPTSKMTTLRVLLHVAAQRDYELHSLDFSTAFLQGSLHEEIWLRQPPGFTGTYPAGTQWSLRRPVYGLRQVPCEWHDTLRTTLAALGFAPSTADPSLFLRTDTSLPPFYVLVYVDDLVFATADTEGLTLVKYELQKRHTCTDLGPSALWLPVPSPQPTPLSTSHSLSAPPSDESVEPSGLYPELVGCLMYLMTCARPDLTYPLSLLARYVALVRRAWGSCLEDRGPVVLTGHADASWVDDSATQRSSQGYTFSLGSGSVSWRSTHSSSVLSSSCEAEIYTGAMAAQELRWLTYLLTDLGEQPHLPPVLYIDNKAMIALCQEHSLEHRTKHIALRYFLARELQQRGRIRLAYVATRANTDDVFTKALPPGDHQRFATVLGLLALVFLTGLVTTCSPPLCLWGTAQTLYEAVVARYSSPATAALGRLLLPYLFPELSAFATVEDLVSHLRASNARYCAALLVEFLGRNPPPIYITLYFIVTHLPDSLRSVKDHFLETSPTLRWTGKVGDASMFRRRVFPSQDITFDKSVPFYRLFPYRSAPPPPPSLFLAPDPLLGTAPVEVAVGSGAAQGAESGGAASGGAEKGVAESEGAGTGGAEPAGVEPGGAEPEGVEPEGVEPGGAESDGAESGGAEPQGVALSGGPAGASPRLSPQQLREWLVGRARLRSGATGAGGAGAAGGGGAGVTTGAGGTGGTVAAGPGGARTRGTGAAGTGGVGGAGAGDPTEPGAAGAGGSSAGGVGAGGAGVGGIDTGGAGAGGAGVGGTGAGGARAGGAGAIDPGGTVRARSYFVPLLQQSQLPLQPASPLPAPSPYTKQFSSLTERLEPASRLVSPVCTAPRIPRSRPPLVSSTHAMTLCPSFVPLRVPLHAPPTSSLLESADASALVAELLDFAAACRLGCATALVAESAPASPPSVGGECALGTDVLEDRQEDFKCLAAAVPRFASMLLAPKGDPDAPDIPTPRSYAEAITDPYSSQWQAAMDAEMASWKSTGTYRDYELHSLDFSTTFLQGSLHKEIWLHRPPGFTGSFPAVTQWSLRRPVYGLRQAPREWHDTLRTTLAALGFAPSTADPSLFLRTDTSLSPFYVLVYVDDLVFATADTEALTLVKLELQKRHTCIDLGELRSYIGLQITWDRARHTITLTQSHMVHQVLQRFGFQFSLPQPTPLSTGHSLSAPPRDESVEPSGLYPELVSCLMYLMTCTRPDLVYPLSLLACYVAPGRHRKVHWDAAKRVLHYLCSSSGMGLVLGGRGPVVLTSWVDDSATQRSSQGYTFSLNSGFVCWRSTRSSSVLSSSCEAEIYTGAMAAQELRWLTYLLNDLGEQPRSPPVLYVDNKAMIALWQEHRLEHRMKHIALRYFLARELQQRGQLRLAYVATKANTADIFTMALPPGDHHRFSTVLGLVPTLPHLLTA
ncbi:unnamed protein product [Closterium sp. NIES-53]